jgi:hypothetical protein
LIKNMGDREVAMRENRLFIGIALLVAILAVGALSCSDDDDDVAPTVTTVAASDTATEEPSGDATPTPSAFEGGRDPVDLPGDGGLGALLTDVRAASQDGFDRVVFEFAKALPGANVEYVSSPIVACGSGLPVEISGDALLEVRMFAAVAHDEAGEPTFGPQAISPGLASIIEVVTICDFEGQVTWIVGLSNEADFVVVTLADPARVVVDIAHP